mmetsp:Transcript_21886/g.50814  ORF Transcript_21886/g.50814 Transcript_21886/m.50814 type:complete len:216 (-) Transcript_21886:1272-1919(-)
MVGFGHLDLHLTDRLVLGEDVGGALELVRELAEREGGGGNGDLLVRHLVLVRILLLLALLRRDVQGAPLPRHVAIGPGLEGSPLVELGHNKVLDPLRDQHPKEARYNKLLRHRNCLGDALLRPLVLEPVGDHLGLPPEEQGIHDVVEADRLLEPPPLLPAHKYAPVDGEGRAVVLLVVLSAPDDVELAPYHQVRHPVSLREFNLVLLVPEPEGLV